MFGMPDTIFSALIQGSCSVLAALIGALSLLLKSRLSSHTSSSSTTPSNTKLNTALKTFLIVFTFFSSIIAILSLVLLFQEMSIYSGVTSITPAVGIQGTIRHVWIDHNTNNWPGDNRVGMTIHAKFEVHNLKRVECRIIAHFYLKSGDKLLDTNGQYVAGDDQVSIVKTFTPPYDGSLYDDLRLFIPYDELHMPPGNQELVFRVSLFDHSNPKPFAETGNNLFAYISTSTPAPATFTPIPPASIGAGLQPKATIQSIWIDHNINENNQTGMRIHVKFAVDNFKDRKGRVSAYFYMASGEKIQAKNGYFAATDGQLAVGSDFVPSYDHALFNDFSFFLPYDALQFGLGKYDLEFLVSIYTPEYRLALSDYKVFTLTVR